MLDPFSQRLGTFHQQFQMLWSKAVAQLGAARFSGALSVETFMRHTSLIGFNRAALEATGSAVQELAKSEGLHSHAESVRRRLS